MHAICTLTMNPCIDLGVTADHVVPGRKLRCRDIRRDPGGWRPGRKVLTPSEYESIEQMKGSMSQEHCPDPTAFERVGYMKTIASFRSGP
jgi:hypothetical protein